MTGRLHHLQIEAELLQGNGGLGRYVLVPGSVDRAARVAAKLADVQVVQNRRRLDVHLGRLEVGGVGIDVAAIPTGMGCPSVDIVVGELLHAGVRRLLRIGTAGAMQHDVKIGDVVVATGAVRDEAASDAYCPRELPATADPLWVEALSRAAQAMGLDERVHVGLLHSKDSFFGREFGEGPHGSLNRDYMARLEAAGVLASEMEAAHLFVLGQVFGNGPRTVRATRTAGTRVRCGAMCAIVGDTVHGFATLEQEQAAEERLIDLALKGIATLHALETA